MDDHQKPRAASSSAIRADGSIADWDAPTPAGFKPTPETRAQYRREHSDKGGNLVIDLDASPMTHEEEMSHYADVPRAPRLPPRAK